MWIYYQSSGKLYRDDKLVDAHCYSGKGVWKNMPDAQNLPNKGPIPQGKYRIGAPRIERGPHGPYVIPLAPDPHNNMYGRSGFLIHGDKIGAPGTASEGCIIANIGTRHKIVTSRDHVLEVKK